MSGSSALLSVQQLRIELMKDVLYAGPPFTATKSGAISRLHYARYELAL